MAVQAEDHPLEYFDFEGVIPSGEYGGGDVIVWDWGTWEPEETDDPARAVQQGELKFELYGERLQGRFVIVQDPRSRPGQGRVAAHPQGATRTPTRLGHRRSAALGHERPDQRRGQGRGRRACGTAARPPRRPTSTCRAAVGRSPARLHPADAGDGRGRGLQRPRLAVRDEARRLPRRGGRGRRRRVRLWTRNRQDAARYFPELAGAPPTWLRARSAVVDGEVVALDAEGNPTSACSRRRARSALRGPARARPQRHSCTTCSTCCYLDGRSLLGVPLEERKRLLAACLREHPVVRYVATSRATARTSIELSRQRRLEGIVAKLRRSAYEPGRRSRAGSRSRSGASRSWSWSAIEPGKGAHRTWARCWWRSHEDGSSATPARSAAASTSARARSGAPSWTSCASDGPRSLTRRASRTRTGRSRAIVIRAEFTEWTSDGLLRQAASRASSRARPARGHPRATASTPQTVAARRRSERGQARRHRATPAQGSANRARASDGLAAVGHRWPSWPPSMP